MPSSLITKNGKLLIRNGAIASIIALVLIALGTMSLQVRDQLIELRSAPIDNVQWNFSQVEVELLIFHHMVAKAQTDSSIALTDVRRRFDLFYSRVDILSAGQAKLALVDAIEVCEGIKNLKLFTIGRAVVFDGPDAQLTAALPDIERQLAKTRVDVRTLSLAAIGVFAVASDENRQSIASLLQKIAVLTMTLIMALVAAAALLFRMYRISEDRNDEIQRSVSHFQSTIGASFDAVIVTDEDNRILEYNDAAERIFGYSKAQAVGQNSIELLMSSGRQTALVAGLKRLQRTGNSSAPEGEMLQLEAKHANGKTFPIEASIATTEGEDGRIFISFVRDISMRVKARKELIKARDDAMAADKSKSRFIAIMSHEMRTPLNGLIAALEIIDSPSMTGKQRKFLNIARDTGSQLIGHVNDVLDISKMEAGKLQVSEYQFAPQDLVAELVHANNPSARARKNTLAIKKSKSDIGLVLGDAALIRQVLVNLIGNAIKYTSDGCIEIGIEHKRLNQDQIMLEFRVSDTGMGIAEQDKKKIFDDFVTLDASDSREVGGTGLGLGISRRIVLAMKGEIGVESNTNTGSTFWVRIPVKPSTHKAPHQIPDIPKVELLPEDLSRVAGLNVLLVEDNEINRIVAREMLLDMGVKVDVAPNGKLGVTAAKNKRYDVILMDISMPVMDGIEATKIIKYGGRSARAEIIGFTAFPDPSNSKKLAAAGLHSFLVKPVTQISLQTALAEAGNFVSSRQKANGYSDMDAGVPLVDPEVVGKLDSLLGKDAMSAMLHRFVDETSAVLKDLSHPDILANPDLVADQLHHLCGSAGAMGAMEFRGAVLRAEQNAKKYGDQQLGEQLRHVATVWEKTKQRILEQQVVG